MYVLTNPVYTNFVQQYFSVWAVEKVFIGQKKLCRIIMFSQIWAAEKNNNKNWWKQDSKIRSLIWWAHQWIFLYFLAWIYEIRKYVFCKELTVAHQQIACLWINLNWFAYNSNQSSPCMKMMFVHAHMNSAISPLWTFFWTFTIWAGDFENHLT